MIEILMMFNNKFTTTYIKHVYMKNVHVFMLFFLIKLKYLFSVDLILKITLLFAKKLKNFKL